MNSPKFKIGDTVFYMNGNEPKKNIILGISSMIGEVKTLAHSLELKPDEVYYLYHFGAYMDAPENKCYASKEDLIAVTFKDL